MLRAAATNTRVPCQFHTCLVQKCHTRAPPAGTLETESVMIHNIDLLLTDSVLVCVCVFERSLYTCAM